MWKGDLCSRNVTVSLLGKDLIVDPESQASTDVLIDAEEPPEAQENRKSFERPLQKLL